MRDEYRNTFIASLLFGVGGLLGIATLVNIASGRGVVAFFLASVTLFAVGCHWLDRAEQRHE